MATPRISIGTGRKESLAQLVERYKIISEPKFIASGLFYFTLKQDLKLYYKLKTMPNHPKDTGLLQESWVPPARLIGGGATDIELTSGFQQYKGSFVSGKFNVYVLNTATVGEQARRKYPNGPKRKKKFSGRHNLKRYMKWVDQRTGFYTKALRTVRQELDKEWKRFVPEYLFEKVGIMI